jgi:transposase
MARFEVITGPERRRRWSADQKRAIVAESFAPGAVVSEVARRVDVSPGQIYRWRQELRAAAGFAQVLIAPADNPEPKGVSPCAAPAIEVELGAARVRIPGLVPADLAAAVLRALSRR